MIINCYHLITKAYLLITLNLLVINETIVEIINVIKNIPITFKGNMIFKLIIKGFTKYNTITWVKNIDKLILLTLVKHLEIFSFIIFLLFVTNKRNKQAEHINKNGLLYQSE